MGGGDQRGAVRGDKAADDRTARLHHLGSDHDIDVAGGGHQRKHRRRVARSVRGQLDIVDRGPGALRHARDGGGLGGIALRPGQILDPAGQDPATLPAHRKDRQLDDAGQARIGGTFAQMVRQGIVQRHGAPSNVSRRAARRDCSQPITLDRKRASRASQAEGLCTTSAR